MAFDTYGEKLTQAPRLTTVDNVFNPFTQFNEWFNYDVFCGYNTSAVLSKRLDENKIVEKELSDDAYAIAVNEIITELILENPLLYRRVLPDSNESFIVK